MSYTDFSGLLSDETAAQIKLSPIAYRRDGEWRVCGLVADIAEVAETTDNATARAVIEALSEQLEHARLMFSLDD